MGETIQVGSREVGMSMGCVFLTIITKGRTLGWQCVLMVNSVGWPSISVRHASRCPDTINIHVTSTLALWLLCSWLFLIFIGVFRVRHTATTSLTSSMVSTLLTPTTSSATACGLCTHSRCTWVVQHHLIKLFHNLQCIFKVIVRIRILFSC